MEHELLGPGWGSLLDTLIMAIWTGSLLLTGIAVTYPLLRERELDRQRLDRSRPYPMPTSPEQIRNERICLTIMVLALIAGAELLMIYYAGLM